MSLDNLAGAALPTVELMFDGHGQFGERHNIERSGPRSILCVHLRELIYRRDSGTCCNCRTFGPPFELDHIIPWSANGADLTSNLQLLCVWCNQQKSNRRSLMPRRPSIVTACGFCNDLVEHGSERVWCARCNAYASVIPELIPFMDRSLANHCPIGSWNNPEQWGPGTRPSWRLINEMLSVLYWQNDEAITIRDWS